MTLDDGQKISQIVFYSVAIVITILTYRRAKHGLLNTVNTEYQKRVMDRLKELSDTLFAEFDENSEHFWARQDFIAEDIERINQDWRDATEEARAAGKWSHGRGEGAEEKRLFDILGPLESDPFVPASIRELVVSFLRERLDVIRDVYWDACEEYRDELTKGVLQPSPITTMRMHNRVVDKLGERGCGVEEIQKEVHDIREAIRKYFEKFIPY